MTGKLTIYLALTFIIFNLAFIISAAKVAAEDCPSGYTCPDTSYSPIYGKTLPVEKNVNKNSLDLNGKTGPQTDQLKFPELKEENQFLKSPEFFDRALPASLRDQLYFATPSALPATLAHIGCGKATVDGQITGDVRVKPAETRFSSTTDYTNLLSVTRFWQSIFVPGKDATLKFKAPQPSGDPNVPSGIDNCLNNAGESLEAIQIENTPPSPLIFLSGIFTGITDFLSKIIGDTVLVKANIQQTKYLPGETALEDQTVGANGFLNAFVPTSVKYTKEGNEEESVPYLVADNPRDAGVVFTEVNSFQSGTTVDLPASIYPEGQGGTIISNPTNSRPVNSGKLDFTIPYRDSSVRLTDAKKQEIIKRVKDWYPDSKIDLNWNTVVNTSIANGINPAFTLAIWIEESAGSSSLANAVSPFGCFPNGDTSLNVPFEQSLTCFTNFTAKEHGSDFVDWAKNFCGPKADPICSNNPNFLMNFRIWYDTLVPAGNPGAVQPL